MRLWPTCCRTCAHAIHEAALVAARVQSMHWCGSTVKSTTHACCSVAPPRTSDCTVSFTLMRLECGSVQMKPASTRRTAPWLPLDDDEPLPMPLMRRRQRARSSLDSGAARAQCLGGWR